MSWIRVSRMAELRGRSDTGFTLVELVVASGVMLAAMVLLLGTLMSGMFATGSARQRQSATSLGNEAVEQIRALPLDRLRQGLNSADTSGDANITSSGCGGAKCFNGELVVENATASAITPLNPHRQTVKIGATSFTISSYVTWYENVTANDTYRLTAQVTWKSLKGVSTKSEVQTIVHYPAGCLSTATRPFSGPCVASFSSNGSVPPGSFHIEDAHPDDGIAAVQGLSFLGADLWLPSASANLLLEQIAVAESGVRTSGATIDHTAENSEDVGLQTATAQANNDPQQPGSIYTTLMSPPQSADSSELTGGGNKLAFNVLSGGDTGKASSTGSAKASPYNCPNLTGYTDNDSLPCAASSMQQSSTTNVTLVLTAGAFSLGNATLGSTTEQSARSIAETERLRTAVSGRCPATTGDGCIHAEATRGPQIIRVGGLPANLTAPVPALCDGYAVKLDGLTDTVVAESGVGTKAPTAIVTAGKVWYWTGSLCTFVEVASMSADIPFPTLTVTDIPHNVVVAISGTIHKPSQTTESGGCSGTCNRGSAKAESHPPLVELTYQVTYADSLIADLALTLDPGTLRAGAAYKVAPS